MLLKNRDRILPLADVPGGRTIAVIGWAAGPIGLHELGLGRRVVAHRPARAG